MYMYIELHYYSGIIRQFNVFLNPVVCNIKSPVILRASTQNDKFVFS